MKRRYYPQDVSSPTINSTIILPTDACVAAYYRQSTAGQVGNNSTVIQTVELPGWLEQQGWPKDNIVLIDTDEGVSGQLKIDERVGMRYLFDLIITDKIKAVACQDEDRLFRDQTQIQVNIFVEACKKHRVIVLTPTMIYDFSHPLFGGFHIKQFRYRCEMAADYITTVVLGKLYAARMHLMMQGLWSGGVMPTGYMVDIRRHLPDGSKNPDWRKYKPFPEYAEVTVEYFRLFLAKGCNLRATVRHISDHGPWYPETQAPEGYKTAYQLKKYRRTHCPTRSGLLALLTNVTLIGHWVVNGTVVRWNNHPPIVPVELFMLVYNRLCDTSMDGAANLQFSPVKEHARPTRDVTRPELRPLCSGLLFAKDNPNTYVGTRWSTDCSSWLYTCVSNPGNDERQLWVRIAKYIDAPVVELLHTKLSSTFAQEVWQQSIDNAVSRFEQQERIAKAQIETLQATLDDLVESLSLVRQVDMVRAIEAKYEQTKAEKDAVERQLTQKRDETSVIDMMRRLQQEYAPTVTNWTNLTVDEQRRVLQAFVERVELEPINSYVTKLIVWWRDSTSDEVVVRKVGMWGNAWLPQELELLKLMVDKGSTQVEICQAIPDRTWKAIWHQIERICGFSYHVGRKKAIKDNETYQDYEHRVSQLTETMSLDTCSPDFCRW